ncbi:hypothetical protein Tco_0356581 [Tanacetum coccineum]
MFKRCLIAADQASVFMAMMSDHNSSNLAPQRQEMSVENVSSGLVPQGQKASDYDNSDPVPPRQNVVPSAGKIDSSQQGLEFLFSPLLEEYYNPTMIKHRMHRFKKTVMCFQLLFIKSLHLSASMSECLLEVEHLSLLRLHRKSNFISL